MSSIGDIAQALADTVQAATGLRSTNYIPDQISAPAFAVTVGNITPGAFKLGELDIVFTGVVYTSRATDRSGQLAAYDCMSPTSETSIFRAVYDAPSLGLADTSAGVQAMRSFTHEEVGAIGYYGAFFDILVVTSGS